jgi:hypothetical protein
MIGFPFIWGDSMEEEGHPSGKRGQQYICFGSLRHCAASWTPAKARSEIIKPSFQAPWLSFQRHRRSMISFITFAATSSLSVAATSSLRFAATLSLLWPMRGLLEFSLMFHHKDLLLAMKQGLVPVCTGAIQLETATRTFLELHKVCYGTRHLLPKHHWLLDIGPQVLRDRLILDAFVVERQHLLVKSVAEHIRNTSQFEVSLLSSLINVQIRTVRGLNLSDQLVGRTSRLEGMPGVLVANKVAIHSSTVTVDEVVLKGLEAGVVLACACEGLELFCFVAPMTKLAQVTPQAATFRRTASLVIWRAADLQHCIAWKEDADGVVLVLAR